MNKFKYALTFVLGFFLCVITSPIPEMGNKYFAEQTFEYINSQFPLVSEHITFKAERIQDEEEMLGYTHVETWDNNKQFTLEIVVDYRVSKNTLIQTIIHEYGHALEFIYLRATPDDVRMFTDHGALWGICQAKAYRVYWNIPDEQHPGLHEQYLQNTGY